MIKMFTNLALIFILWIFIWLFGVRGIYLEFFSHIPSEEYVTISVISILAYSIFLIIIAALEVCVENLFKK